MTDTKHTPGTRKTLEQEIRDRRDLAPGAPLAMIGVPSMTLQGWAEQAAELRAQRDELLGALAPMVDMFERHISSEEGPDDAAARWDAARAAIARARGEA